jgi:hypothetical protein
MTMSPELWRRAVSALREARRTTIAGPLVDAFAVRAILRHIAGDSNTVRVVAPDEFAPYLRARLAERDGLLAAGPPFEYAVLRQTQIGALDAASIDLLRRDYSCLYANRLFVLFGLEAWRRLPRRRRSQPSPSGSTHSVRRPAQSTFGRSARSRARMPFSSRRSTDQPRSPVRFRRSPCWAARRW